MEPPEDYLGLSRWDLGLLEWCVRWDLPVGVVRRASRVMLERAEFATVHGFDQVPTDAPDFVPPEAWPELLEQFVEFLRDRGVDIPG
jgi:hypothetical protein